MSLPIPPPTNSSSKEPPDKPSLNHRSSIQKRPSIDAPLTDNDIPAQPQPSIAPLVRPHFTPFFTLINDVGTSATHHPTNIHYLFSDDDPSLLTATCLSILQPKSPSSSSPRTNIRPHPSAANNQGNPSTSSSTTSTTSTSKSASTQQLHAPQQDHGGHDSRVLVLDVAPSGTEIIRAHSLSPAWQILSTSLAPAPTWAESASETGAGLAASSGEMGGPAAASGGYMLRISGTEVPKNGDGIGGGKDVADAGKKGETGKRGEMGMAEGEFAALMKEFDTRMKILRTVVVAGEKKDGADGNRERDGDGDREAEANGEGDPRGDV